MNVNTARFLGAVAVVLVISAGTVSFWQAWVYLALNLVWLKVTGSYFLHKDPALVERRLTQDERGEKERLQRVYLAAILDLFSRRVVGHATSERIDRALVLKALGDALGRRAPQSGLMHHSDRGSQYASGDYQTALRERGVVCSMSRKGNCWDNAVAESFFATLKTECVYPRRFATRAEAREAIFTFIEVFYNGRRRHSTLGYLTPMEFENKFIEEKTDRECEKAAA